MDYCGKLSVGGLPDLKYHSLIVLWLQETTTSIFYTFFVLEKQAVEP